MNSLQQIVAFEQSKASDHFRNYQDNSMFPETERIDQ